MDQHFDQSIIIDGVSRIYNMQNYKISALSPVSFKINEFDRIILKGNNGCGKSTLFKILSTLINPSTGKFSIFGSDYKDPAKVRSMVAYIPETLNFDYSMTPVDLWKMMTALRGLSTRNRQEFEDYLTQVNLLKWIDKPLGSFSLGMKKRVTLAVWLTLNPRILLLDEFESGLDVDGKGLVADLFKAKDELTIMAITHNDNFLIGKEQRRMIFNDILDQPIDQPINQSNNLSINGGN